MPSGSGVFLILIVTAWIGGCYSTSDYEGDGTLTETKQRYELTLGEIDLSVEGKSTYKLKGLPEETFTIGLDVKRPTGGGDPIYIATPLNADIKIRLLNERGEVVIDEFDSLDQWVWSGSRVSSDRSFVYRRGSTIRVPIGDGVTRIEFVGKRADEGWGSYFEARGGGIYELEIAVVTADPNASNYQVQLTAHGNKGFSLL
jgi:hypothetical protein